MGIDCYLNWPGKTEADERAQVTGFSITAGASGYLREAYHGGPYVTRFLLQEGFEDDDAREAVPEDQEYLGVPIPAATLRERLPKAVLLAIYRDAHVYGRGEPEVGGTIDLDDATDPGDVKTSPTFRKAITDVFASIALMKGGGDEKVLADSITSPELIEKVKESIVKRQLPDYALSFADFVQLAEAKEAEHGQPCTVYVSY